MEGYLWEGGEGYVNRDGCRGDGAGGWISFSDVRLNDLTKDLSCCVQDRFSTAR